jgi:hypothetical protein
MRDGKQRSGTNGKLQNHPWIWLLAIIFGAGGAGTVWFSQNNEIERIRGQLDDLKVAKADLANQIATLRADLAREKVERDACARNLIDAQSRADRCSGSATVTGSQGVAIYGGRVTTGSPGASSHPGK